MTFSAGGPSAFGGMAAVVAAVVILLFPVATAFAAAFYDSFSAIDIAVTGVLRNGEESSLSDPDLSVGVGGFPPNFAEIEVRNGIATQDGDRVLGSIPDFELSLSQFASATGEAENDRDQTNAAQSFRVESTVIDVFNASGSSDNPSVFEIFFGFAYLLDVFASEGASYSSLAQSAEALAALEVTTFLGSDDFLFQLVSNTDFATFPPPINSGAVFSLTVGPGQIGSVQITTSAAGAAVSLGSDASSASMILGFALALLALQRGLWRSPARRNIGLESPLLRRTNG